MHDLNGGGIHIKICEEFLFKNTALEVVSIRNQDFDSCTNVVSLVIHVCL